MTSYKSWIDLAIQVGKTWQSPQTGWIHYNEAQKGINKTHHPIPLYENFLFGLALIKSRMVDMVQEGQQILSNILSFYKDHAEKSEGNFSTYLHYPLNEDSWDSFRMLLPLYSVWQEGSVVLSQKLFAEVESILITTVYSCYQKAMQADMPQYYTFATAAVAASLPNNTENKDVIEWGTSTIHKLSDWMEKNAAVLPPSKSIHILLATALLAKHAPNLWQTYCAQLQNMWCPITGNSLIPHIEHRQWKEEAYIHPVEWLIKAYKEEDLPSLAEASEISPSILVTALLRNLKTDSTLESESSKPVIDTYRCIFEENASIALVNRNSYLPFHSSVEPHPVRIFWGSCTERRSLVAEVDKAKLVSEYKNGSIDLLFDIDPEIKIDAKKPTWIVSFFTNLSHDIRWLVNERPGNLFYENDVLQGIGNILPFSFKFEVVKGEARVCGHVLRSNRVGQLCSHDEHKFTAFDWMIGFRLVEVQESPVALKISLSWKKDELA